MEVIQKFLDYLEVEKRYSQHTITSYRRDLEDFKTFLLETEGQEDLLDASKRVVRNFIVHLNTHSISKRSINRKLSCLRSFFHFYIKIGDVKESPLQSIDSLKFYAERQIPFSKEEMDEVKEVYRKGDEKTILVEAIIETLYQTGMRKSELCKMKLTDVDFSLAIIKVIGKGNKQREIPLSEDLKKILEDYLKVRDPKPEFQDLFYVNYQGKKLTEKFVYSKVNSYLSYVSSKKKKSPHMLRHTFATHVLDNGAEINAVKEILGHASLASTQVYTHASIDQLKKVINQAHPRATKKNEL
ncbi:tyrosine-type recombinase/integrase [Elizabethkingia sp. JS20170427COW]|uniref:tyrosine-type recombinase/integrase n=1 Tax=Elizabethkingia sp. JS20170427COW TaxID=2583851 RepID=UPI0011103C68|nr:tyrosine-type recombinase/integrase [Elizabethkingia sp. JS20170427COW]QCX53493.1 integrase [Elizabethkingia sp. JS20170427COW]